MKTTTLFLVALLTAGRLLAQGASPNIERGVTPEKAYSVSDVDVINVFNANLNVPVRIGPSYPVSEHLSYQWTLHYGGNGWEEESTEDVIPNTGPPLQTTNYSWTFPSRLDNAGFGWRLSMGRIIPEAWVGCGYPYGGSSNGLAYVSPDGAVHCFRDRLHNSVASEVLSNISYTQDGTYLRMHKTDDLATIEFPDGTVHEFVPRFGTEANPTPAHPSNGQVVKMKDRFGNWVTIDYNATTGVPSPSRGYASYKAWHVEDSQGRHQYVYLIPTPEYAEVITSHQDSNLISHNSIAEINMPAFGSTNGAPNRATYVFHYLNEPTGTHTEPPFTLISRKCSTGFVYEHLGNDIRVPLLASIEMPEGVQYTFANDQGTAGACTGTTGTLKEMTLPTGAKVDWTYQFIEYPPNSATKYYRKAGSPPLVLTESVGVKQRTVTESSALGGAILERRTYDVDPQYLPETSKHLAVTVTDLIPGGTGWLRKTLSYFSICPVNCTDPAAPGLYGLPVTRQTPDSSAPTFFLSTITYDTTGAEIERTYLKHEADISLSSIPVGHTGFNRRSFAQRTYHYYTGGSHYTESTSSDYDGYGHYRSVNSKASFDSVERTTTTAYKGGQYAPDGTSFSIIAAGEPWLTELYDSVQSTHTDAAGTQTTSRTDFCFDPLTGFLKGKRSARKTDKTLDLLTIYRDTDNNANDGNVSYEASYGGDATPLTTTSGCADPGGTAPNTLKHMYSYGVRNNTQSVGLNFPSLKLDIDPTGLPSKSTTGDVATTFDYDLLGRMKSVKPDGRANADYTYDVASRPVSLTLKRVTPPSAPLTEARYYYDGLGRLIQQRQTMPSPGSPWSAAQYAYDAVGRKVSATVAAGATSGAYSSLPGSTKKTTFTYDALGRVLTTVTPDGATTTALYEGVRTLHRFQDIATSSSATTSAETIETYDALGRLSTVQQNGVTASYRHDVGDRLRRVDLSAAGALNQNPRIFEFDSAGLLTSEQHPESGLTLYPQYDARGQVKQKRPADCRYDLDFTYDAAGRTTFVKQHQNPNDCMSAVWVPIKEFTYGDTANAADGSYGKLRTAKRHNRNSFGDVLVTESYVYGDTARRLTQKTTTVSEAVMGMTMQQFTQEYAHDSLDELLASEYPVCGVAACGQATHAGAAMTYDHGFLTSVKSGTLDSSFNLVAGPEIAGLAYTSSGMRTKITHSNQVTDDIAQDSSGIPRPASITFSGFGAQCTAPTVSMSPSGTDLSVPYQQTVTWTATASGTGPLTYEWHRSVDGVDTIVDNDASYTTPPMTGVESYWLVVQSSCGKATSAHIVVRGIPNAPTGLQASRAQGGGALVHWNSVAGASKYVLQRKMQGVSYVYAGETTSTSLPDACASGSTCVYQVIAVSAANQSSAPSNKDLVTIVDFSPLTAVRASDFNAILAAVNLVRAANNDGGLTWTMILPAGVPAPAASVRVDARHVTALRTAMDNACSVLGVAPAPYEDPNPAGMLIRRKHLEDLQQRSQ